MRTPLVALLLLSGCGGAAGPHVSAASGAPSAQDTLSRYAKHGAAGPAALQEVLNATTQYWAAIDDARTLAIQTRDRCRAEAQPAVTAAARRKYAAEKAAAAEELRRRQRAASPSDRIGVRVRRPVLVLPLARPAACESAFDAAIAASTRQRDPALEDAVALRLARVRTGDESAAVECKVLHAWAVQHHRRWLMGKQVREAERAESLYAGTDANCPDAEDALFYRAELAFDRKDLALAKSLYDKLKREYPDSNHTKDTQR